MTQKYKWKSRDIQNALIFHIDRPDIIWMPNVVFGGGECDLLAISRHSYATEYEIKISMADWNIDKEKKKWDSVYREQISYFSYCVPLHLALKSPSWIPEGVGILSFEYIAGNGGWLKIAEIRRAHKLFGSRKLTEAEVGGIVRKGWYRYRNARYDEAKAGVKLNAANGTILQ